MTCELTVHEGRDHNLVTDMRDAGELDALLRRIAAGDDDEGGGAAIPEEFRGFEDCPDF